MQLYDYQLKALAKTRNGCILNGGVGSGKSITALAYYYLQNGGDLAWLEGKNDVMKRMPNPQDLYIITTAAKRDKREWELEMIPFLLSTTPTLTPYKNTVVIDSWNNIQKYTGISGAMFLFDEDHLTGSGKWVKAFYKIAAKNNWIVLSATPGDSYIEYAPIFIANGYFKNITQFKREHVVYARYLKYPKIDRYIGTQRLDRLRRRVLIDMPVKRHTTQHHFDIWCDYDVQQYKEIIRNRWNPFEERPIETASEFCYLLRQVVNSHSDRQKRLLELLEEHPRAIIFYSCDYELEILRSLSYAAGTEVAEWNGHKHQPIPDSERWVYLCHYSSAEGWQCIKTDTVIFFSQSYSYKMTIQAAGRIDRATTPYRNLYYYHLKSRSGIDLAISKALKDKKDFNKAIFSMNQHTGTARVA